MFASRKGSEGARQRNEDKQGVLRWACFLVFSDSMELFQTSKGDQRMSVITPNDLEAQEGSDPGKAG
jgi:hypothetical protein